MITALIFDFDGLIVDTETPAFESWVRIYAEFGCELALDTWSGALGTNHGFDAMGHLIEQVAARDPQRGETLRAQAPMVLEQRQALKDQQSAGQTLLPGVLELLDAAAEAGLPCAVASSSSYRWVGGWLERLGIRGRFGCIRTADDVVRTKPDPALFLAAAACLGRPAAECLVLEDSANGIKAARAAGCPVVAVPGPLTSKLVLPPGDLTIPALNALPLAELLAAVERARA